MKTALKALGPLLLLAVAASCAHAVRIISIPAGAKVTLDGRPLGTAPALHVERSSPPGLTHVIRAELQGFPPITLKETRALCTSTPNLLLDAFVAGLFFGFCLKDEYVLDFTDLMPAPRPSPSPSPASAPSYRK